MGAPGFDDAPMAKIKLGSPKHVSLIYPYYDNPDFLMEQFRNWASYPPRLREAVGLTIVDDGSPTVPAVEVFRKYKCPIEFKLYRIRVDVRWNWLAARNIAMFNAPPGWCLLTDMDHMVTPEMAGNLVDGDHDPSIIYRLSRREHTGEKIHCHPNSMFMTRSMFWKIGGYDEALSGFYGTDGDWRRRCAATAPVRTLPDELVRYEYQGDSSTRGYKRKQPEDAGKKRIIAMRGRNWKPRVLSFKYDPVIV